MNQQLNNPLRQFFRRPAIYLRLPSGGKYSNPNVVRVPESGELPVYPMTAIDDITSKTPDALFNGTAVVEIIRSCIPDILDPWQLNNVDLDAALVAIRTASDGNDLEIVSQCPNCSEEAKYGVNLVAYLGNLSVEHYTEELDIGDLSVKFKSLSFKDVNEFNMRQFEIQKTFSIVERLENVEERARQTNALFSNITDITMVALSKTVEHIRTPTMIVTESEYIYDFLRNCDNKTFELIKEKNIELKQKSDIKPMKIKCIYCQHEYEQTVALNFTDFFG